MTTAEKKKYDTLKKELSAANKTAEGATKKIELAERKAETSANALKAVQKNLKISTDTNKGLSAKIMLGKSELVKAHDETKEAQKLLGDSIDRDPEITEELLRKIEDKAFARFKKEAHKLAKEMADQEAEKEAAEIVPQFIVKQTLDIKGDIFNFVNNRNSKQGGYSEKQAKAIAKIYKGQFLPVHLVMIPEDQRLDTNFILVYKGAINKQTVIKQTKQPEEDGS